VKWEIILIIPYLSRSLNVALSNRKTPPLPETVQFPADVSFIDAHAHLLWPNLISDLPQILSAAKKVRVNRIVNIGINLKDLNTILKFPTEFHSVFHVVGLHPEETIKLDANWEQFELKIRENADKFVGIGEIGLDYWETKEADLRKQQEIFFRRQLELAVELEKPVVIHCRNAEKPALKILQENIYQDIPGVLLHCFGGSQKYLEMALARENWMFTVPTSVVHKKIHRLLALKVPINRILLETDSPFLKPYPDLPRNEPQYVVYGAQEIANLKEISLEMVARQTTSNAEQFFSLPSRNTN